jgi:hypothetical protein
MAGWATPDANAMNDGEKLETWDARQTKNKAKHGNGNGAGMPIAVQVLTIGPPKMAQLASGPTLSGFPAGTASTAGYQLNPFFSLWLMGFPASWGMAGFRALRKMKLEQSAKRPTASLSARKSRTARNSSKAQATPLCLKSPPTS